MDDDGREKFEAFRLRLLYLSAAAVFIPSCLMASMCGGKLGNELLIAVGWEMPVLLGGIVLAGVFLFVYVMRFMQLPPEAPPPPAGPDDDDGPAPPAPSDSSGL